MVLQLKEGVNMTRVAIIGGKLQGTEAVYLAAKAGIETVVIDKRDNVPAKNLSNHFLCNDVLNKDQALIDALRSVDFVLPALENEEVLVALTELAETYNLILAFDLKSYLISSSKILSDKLMHDNHIPAPQYYPNCKSPYIVKPSSASGSEGVKYMDNADEVETFLKNIPSNEKWVAQEFLSGRSYSIEIIGKSGNYRTYEVTEIIIDEVYDCKRVTTPCDIPEEMKSQFADIALRLADILQLNGIMDVEVIDDNGSLKVLEIDARIPSQTPTAVYHATGMNMVEELRDIFCDGNFKKTPWELKKCVSYEHLLIGDGQIRVQGEHIIGQAGPLNLMPDFCGADEALTDYRPGDRSFRGTFINIADNEQQLNEKRENMLKQISLLQGEKLEYFDLSPLHI
jgi:pyrrolysine biosynthesis protein PylC